MNTDMTMDNDEPRVYVVTGAASGIGRAVAEQLLDQDHRVVGADLLGAAFASMAAESARRYGRRWLAIPADVSDEDDVRGLFTRCLAELGTPWGVVASAGVRMPRTAAVDVAMDLWDSVMRVNLRGTFLVDREAARCLSVAGRGAIVNVSSVSGRIARPGQVAYAASKAAINHLTEVLALELAVNGVRVNGVAPGTTATPMIQLAIAQDSDSLMDERIRGSLRLFRPGIPLRRIASAQDQADTICFLLSDKARHITGQILYVDGGETVI